MRKNITFLISIILSIFVLYSGMYFTVFSLNKQTDSILGKQSRVLLPTVTGENGSLTKFTKEELANIAKSYNVNKEWLLHDPLNEQISMDEALKITNNTINDFVGKGILPKNFQNVISLNYKATLGTKKYQNNSKVIITSQYSWWDICFREDDMFLEIYLNAVTGKIMKLVASTGEKQENPIDIEKFATVYLNYLELNDVRYEIQETNSIKLSDMNLTLVLDISSVDDYYNINFYFEEL